MRTKSGWKEKERRERCGTLFGEAFGDEVEVGMDKDGEEKGAKFGLREYSQITMNTPLRGILY